MQRLPLAALAALLLLTTAILALSRSRRRDQAEDSRNQNSGELYSAMMSHFINADAQRFSLIQTGIAIQGAALAGGYAVRYECIGPVVVVESEAYRTLCLGPTIMICGAFLMFLLLFLLLRLSANTTVNRYLMDELWKDLQPNRPAPRLLAPVPFGRTQARPYLLLAAFGGSAVLDIGLFGLYLWMLRQPQQFAP